VQKLKGKKIAYDPSVRRDYHMPLRSKPASSAIEVKSYYYALTRRTFLAISACRISVQSGKSWFSRFN